MAENKIPASREDDSQDAKDINDGKFFAAVGYVSVLCLVPLILKKENKFALFHGKQGLVLFILEFGAGILKIVPAIGDVVFTLAFVICGILSLVGILKVLMNEYWEMPLISDVAQKISL
jgi:uncharacterized membrane protein